MNSKRLAALAILLLNLFVLAPITVFQNTAFGVLANKVTTLFDTNSATIPVTFLLVMALAFTILATVLSFLIDKLGKNPKSLEISGFLKSTSVLSVVFSTAALLCELLDSSITKIPPTSQYALLITNLALTFLTDWPLSKVKDYNNFSTWMTKQLNSNGVVNFDVDVRNKVIAESKKFSFSQKEGKKENIWIT